MKRNKTSIEFDAESEEFFEESSSNEDTKRKLK